MTWKSTYIIFKSPGYNSYQVFFTEFRLQLLLGSEISLSLELVLPKSSSFSWIFRLFFGSPSPPVPDLTIINHQSEVQTGIWKCEIGITIKLLCTVWYTGKFMISIIWYIYLWVLFFGTFVWPETTLVTELKNIHIHYQNYKVDRPLVVFTRGKKNRTDLYKYLCVLCLENFLQHSAWRIQMMMMEMVKTRVGMVMLRTRSSRSLSVSTWVRARLVLVLL